VGIITKTDLNRAYLRGKPLETCAADIMSKTLFPLKLDMTRDQAAHFLHEHKIHHAVVQGASGA
jgi:CBS-domain-containing membrane protein